MDNNIKKRIYKTFYKFSFKTLPFGAVLSVIFVAIFVFLGFIIGLIGNTYSFSILDILLVTLVFAIISIIVEPYIYSYFINNLVLRSPRSSETGLESFIATGKIGRKPPFKGLMGIFRNLVLTLLIFITLFLASTFIASFIGTIEGTAIYPLYHEISLLDVNSATLVEDIEVLMEENLDAIYTVLTHATFAASFVSFYFLLHKISKNTIYYLAAGIMTTAASKFLRVVIRKVRKDNYKEYMGIYYGALWPLTLGYCIIYPSIYYLIYFLGPDNSLYSLIMISAILGILILYFAFYPIVCNTNEVIWHKYCDQVFTNYIEMGLESIKQARLASSFDAEMSLEEIDQIEKNLLQIKDHLVVISNEIKAREPLEDRSENKQNLEK